MGNFVFFDVYFTENVRWSESDIMFSGFPTPAQPVRFQCVTQAESTSTANFNILTNGNMYFGGGKNNTNSYTWGIHGHYIKASS